MNSLFHLAFHVTDLQQARQFYGGVLGCTEGRSTDTWVDFDFFGHQLSLHLGQPFATSLTGMVGRSPATPISGTLYKCTATNTWTSYYTPYTYPHPLAGGAVSAPNAPTNVRIR